MMKPLIGLLAALVVAVGVAPVALAECCESAFDWA